jgi:hypothetical protein
MPDHHIGKHETNFWTKRHKYLNMEKYRSYQNSKNTKPYKNKIKKSGLNKQRCCQSVACIAMGEV